MPQAVPSHPSCSWSDDLLVLRGSLLRALITTMLPSGSWDEETDDVIEGARLVYLLLVGRVPVPVLVLGCGVFVLSPTNGLSSRAKSRIGLYLFKYSLWL